jgi:flagellum-specific ATP synthase
MTEITDENLQKSAQKFRRLVSIYMENRDLILMGGYTSGQDLELDEAVAIWPRLMAHIQQVETEKADFTTSKDALNNLMR